MITPSPTQEKHYAEDANSVICNMISRGRSDRVVLRTIRSTFNFHKIDDEQLPGYVAQIRRSYYPNVAITRDF